MFGEKVPDRVELAGEVHWRDSAMRPATCQPIAKGLKPGECHHRTSCRKSSTGIAHVEELKRDRTCHQRFRTCIS